jgi:hypothetical protein
MAKNQTARVRPDVLKADEAAYTALQAIPDYAPANAAFSKTTMTGNFGSYQTAQQAEINAQNTLDAARDAAAKTEWVFHNAMLGVKAQVIAQYGDDSDEAQALGLKKKSERKSPTRKAKAAAK